jgi:type II secretory pathway pseudopilin PulG
MCPSLVLNPRQRNHDVLTSWRGRAGVTLVEMLTSLMVASILMVALLQTLASASDSWARQSRNFSAQREGRVAMRILADDLAAVVLVPEWARQAALSGSADARSSVTAGDPRTGFGLMPAMGPLESARLMFLRASATEGRGDLQLVMYGVALSSDGGASGLTPRGTSQKLVRCVFSAGETFRRLKRHLELRTPLADEADWQALAELRHEPGAAEAGVVAHDVIRFDVKGFDDLMASMAPSSGDAWHPAKWMDVTLRVTNRQTGQSLETAGDWKGLGATRQILLNGTRDLYHDDPEVKTYTMRLRLPSTGL